MEIEIKNVAEFEQHIGKGNVLVDFYATWCGPCNMVAPIVAQIAKEHQDLTVLRVDVDEVEALARQYNIFSIPTLLHFVDGKLVDQKVGFAPKPALEAFLGY